MQGQLALKNMNKRVLDKQLSTHSSQVQGNLCINIECMIHIQSQEHMKGESYEVHNLSYEKMKAKKQCQEWKVWKFKNEITFKY